MHPKSFVAKLKNIGYDFFVGVPCSFFKSVINYTIDDPDVDYHMASNEGAALAMAAGAYLSGKLPVIMLQNSGFGNLVNPLTSLSMIYDIPTLLLVSGRGYNVDDEPQHFIMGTRLKQMLEGVGLTYWELPTDDSELVDTLEEATRVMFETNKPVVLIVQKDTFSKYELIDESKRYKESMLTRTKAIEIISTFLHEDDAVIATTGTISRSLYQIHDRPQNFYMMGSMGHAISIGLSIAISQPSRKIHVLDGDGAVLMHLGAMSTVGFYNPKNLVHIVLDNESYESTGGQMTTSGCTNLQQIAKACNYQSVFDVHSEEELTEFFENQYADCEGPLFLRVLIARTVEKESIPRISEKYAPEEHSRNFRKFLGKS